MTLDRSVKILLGILTGLALLTAISQASTVLAPLALALFIIAVIWPLQSRLQSLLPRFIALAIVVLVTAAACFCFAYVVSWGFTRVARTYIMDQRHQAMYDAVSVWLDGHGLAISGLWTDYFNASSLLRLVQQITSRVNTMMSLWLIGLIYVILGLFEVDDVRRKLLALGNRNASDVILNGITKTAAKLQRYAIVRTLMSVTTGLLVGGAAWVAGLPLATEWAVMAFALNYIPVIGPFIATVLPTIWALTQFETWQAVLALFICLNIIQFAVGSYAEPRVAGSALSISPFVVLFSVFLWTFLWGVFGAFIGVPITIAILTFCGQHPSSRWVAELLGEVEGREVDKSAMASSATPTSGGG